MNPEDIVKIRSIIEKNPAYHFDAYLFVLSALGFILKRLKKKRHVSGAELMDGIRTVGSDLYGRLAPEVFRHWGINDTLDFGRIVFALVDSGILRKRAEDTLEEFKDVYDFEEVFVHGYEFPLPFKKLTKA